MRGASAGNPSSSSSSWMEELERNATYVGLGPLLGELELLEDFLPGGLPGLVLHLLVPPSSLLHELPEPGDRVVVLHPTLHLLLRPVRRRVIAGGVMAHSARTNDINNQPSSSSSSSSLSSSSPASTFILAEGYAPIGHGFDEDRSALLESEPAGGLGDVVDGPDIVTIDSDRGHAVARTSPGDAVTSVLLLHRRGDGVTVVSAEEDGGRTQGGREVERRMEVSLHGRERPCDEPIRFKLSGGRRGEREEVRYAPRSPRPHRSSRCRCWACRPA